MIRLLQRTRRPDITFRRDGRITVTARVVRLLALRPGDSINVAFSGPECYLVAQRNDNAVGRHAARCHASKKGSLHFCANSAALCRLMLDRCGVTAQRASFMVGEPETVGGEVCLPVIYKMPIYEPGN